jgi:hypothetical protein
MAMNTVDRRQRRVAGRTRQRGASLLRRLDRTTEAAAAYCAALKWAGRLAVRRIRASG